MWNIVLGGDAWKEMPESSSANTKKSSSRGKRKLDISLDSLDEDGVQEYGQDSIVRTFVNSNGVSEEIRATLNDKLKEHERDKVVQVMARWFYSSGIPFNAVNNPFFHKLIEKIGNVGKGFEPPTYHETRETLLKREVVENLNVVKEHKEEWKRTGCSIILDGWTDHRKRKICNFFVNSLAGTIFLNSLEINDVSQSAERTFEMLDRVVEKVGEENVVQVVTENAADYKEAGRLLMEKRKTLFWTPCAAHCIELMLEDFDKCDPLQKDIIMKSKLVVSYIYSSRRILKWIKEFTNGKELVRRGATRFVTSYLTLKRLNELKYELIGFFASEKWRKSVYSQKRDGKEVWDVVFDTHNFWPNVELCLMIVWPLINVLRMVESNDKPAMGFVYEAIECAKEEIKTGLQNSKKRYETFLDAIDKRWEGILGSPLHATSYWLNPQIQYRPDYQSDAYVKSGLFECINKLVPDVAERDKITLQLVTFRFARGFFGREEAIRSRNTLNPADWWDLFGVECPELQRFAIRVLSLTCSASVCERNWRTLERLHSKKGNRSARKRMNRLVFVMFNLRLKERERARERQRKLNVEEDSLEELSSDDEWITRKEDSEMSNDRYWWRRLNGNTNLDFSDEEEINDSKLISNHSRRTFDEEPSGSQRNRKQIDQMQRLQLVDADVDENVDEDEDEDEDKDEDEDEDKDEVADNVEDEDDDEDY